MLLYRRLSRWLFLLALVTSWSSLLQAASYQMPDTQMHVMVTSDTRNQEYMLYLQLPAGYHDAKNAQKRYPVVYVLDAYWDFPVIAGAKSGLVFDGIVPEFIVVGIGYSKDGKVEEGEIVNTLRQIDYTPVQDKNDRNTGDAAAFLGFIKQQVLPFVESNYRTENYRVLSGTSWGGLFSLYTMFEEPGLFQGHISITPAVSGFHRWAFVRESEFFSADSANYFGPPKKSLDTHLYMSVGSHDQLPNFTQESIAFSEILKDRPYKDFDFKFELKENEHHASIKLASFGQGLKHAFSGYKQ